MDMAFHLRLSSIQEYQMKFHYQDRHLIPDIDHKLPRTASRDGFLVRTIRVISFDLNKKQHAKTRKWAHQEALKNEDQLKSGQNRWEEKAKLFKKEYERVQKKPLKRNPNLSKGRRFNRGNIKMKTWTRHIERFGKSPKR